MDERIINKVNLIKKKEEEEKQKEIQKTMEYEIVRKKRIIDDVPEARILVEKFILDKIAEAIAKNEQFLSLQNIMHDLKSNIKINYLPLEESFIIALKEIDGLTLKETWVPPRMLEWAEGCREFVSGHFEYDIYWNKEKQIK